MPTHRSRLAFALFLAGTACGCGSAHAGTPAAGGAAGAAGTTPNEAALPGDGSSPSATPALPAAAPELAGWAAVLATSCSDGYTGDEGRAAFDPNRSGPHGLLFISPDGSADPLNNVIPDAWRPRSAGDVELVACVGHVERTPYEVCPYIGTSQTVTRLQQSVSVRVVSPRSGAIQLITTKGAEPPRCPDTTSTWSDELGDPPDPRQIESDIVDRFVPVPDCGASRPLASCLQCWRDTMEAGPSGCGIPLIDASEPLPPARTGSVIALDWQWESFTNNLFQPAVGIDWSASADAAVLTRLDGPSTSFTPDTARKYSFLANARLPATPDGQLVQTRAYTIEARDRPVVQDVLGISAAAFARLGQASHFQFSIASRPDGGYLGESARWTWIERPAGSSALDPTLDLAGTAWSFVPDLAGTYRVQLEYNDGVGFSAPVTSAPITAIAGPIVSGLVDEQGSVGVPLRLEGQATHAIGYPAFQWTLSSVPGGSALTANYFAGMDSNSIVFVADVAGAYVFDVVVSDSAGQSDPVQFIVTAS